MDKLLHPLARAVSHLLIYTTALTPLHPAFAAGINAANGNTQVVIKPGNVPVVNIATPNGAGISHNTYKDFNVGTPGAVLNNATQGGKTQLGIDIINGNPNLKGKPAELIINEVTGGSRSELQGKLEVFGNKANVMIANPNGITCDGCGFINAPGVTLTTGKPQFDKQGALEALEVKKGGVTIGSKGLDGSGADYVDILSRATELNGKINAKNLSLTQGTNRISFKDGTVKPIAGEGAKPQLAVDTKALGGMYANKIRLVATEDGVGVNLKDLDSKQRDITLSVNGKIALSGKTHSKTDLNVSARELHVTPGTIAQADGNATLAATTLVNNGQVTTSGDMRIFSDHVRNAGDNAKLHANKSLWIQKDAQGNKANYVENRSARIQTNSGDLVIRTNKLDNVRQVVTFKTSSQKDTSATDPHIPQTRETREVATLSREGILYSGGNAYINATTLWNDISRIEAEKDLFLTGDSLSNKGFQVGEKTSFGENNARVIAWSPKHTESGKLLAGGNLVADFKTKIEVHTPTPDENQLNDVKTIDRPEAIKAKNILLHATNIVNTDAINAAGNITAIAEDRIVLGQGILSAGNSLDLMAGNTIDAWQSELKGLDVTLTARNGEIKLHTSEKPNYYYIGGIRRLGKLEATRDLTLTAGSTITLLNTLLAPQSRNITMTAPGSISIVKNDAILTRNRPGESLTPEMRLGYFDNLLHRAPMNASGSITLNSGGYLALRGAEINAGQDVTLLAGHNADLNYRALDGKYGHPFASSRTPELGSKIHAGGNLLINSARDLGTQGGSLSANGNITLLAGQNMWLSNVAYSAIDAANDNNKDDRHAVTTINAGKNLTAAANNQLQTYGARLTSGGNMTLTSGGDMRFEAVQNHTYREGGNEFTETRTQQGTELNAGGLMTVIAGGSLLFQATKLLVKGVGANWKPAVILTDWRSRVTAAEQADKAAQARLQQALNDKKQADLDVERYRYKMSWEGNHRFEGTEEEMKQEEKRRTAAVLQALNAMNEAKLQSSAAQKRIEQYQREKAETGLELAAVRQEAQSKEANEANQKAQVEAHNRAEAMRSGNMDIAAKGGWLYAQAMEESSHYEKTTKKRKWWGKKTEVKQTRHDVTNKVTEFTAAGNITLMSRDDSTYEASKIAAGKNAKLTSTHGQVNFRAVKNTSFEQTVSNSKGFFIKQSNKGYEDNKWVLPSIYTGGTLTVNAANGISADVKAKNGQSLQSAINALGNTPGTTWVKGLNQRNDVRWNTVKDAYDSWDYKSQHLNPAVAAVIAIAAAAVTAGSSLTTVAAGNVAGAVGGGAVTSGAVTAGMSALASQAAVALVENQGNLSKTLRVLGSSDSVKAIATAMAIGGALNGFDSAMGWSKDAAGKPLNPNNVKLPQLSNGDWSKVAQRVAGQSVISSSLNIAINGGSFKDNLTNALLANIGGQVQAEGAHLIGDNGAILNVPGRAVSHAVLAGISAEIGKGNAKGAAAGALAAELAGIIINDNLVKTEGWQERQAQISRVSGAFVGAIATGKASGANSGANAGEFVERFNRQLHQEELNAIKDLAKGDKEKEARLMAASCRKVACTTQEALNSDERKQFEALMKKYPSTRDEDGLIDNYWVQKERQRFGNYPAFAGYDSEKLFTYDLGDQITDSQLFARNQQIEQISKLTGWSPNWVNASVMAVSIASTFAGMGKANVGNQYLSSKLVGPTSAWKGYLVNEKTIQQAATFKNRVTELRAGLPSDPKRSGNVAVASINVEGMPKEMAAHSSVSTAGKGLVGKGGNNFKYSELPNKAGELIARNTDSEYKILDNLADKLGKNVAAKGSVTIFTERPACGSCLGVIEQFQNKYPGIKVDVLDNNGIVLRPGAKK
ncbi:TPA: DUF637 domain-containing protein [Serratia marcescens]